MSTPARLERLALCELFDELGPDEPTLCGDWTTRDLAAHLVVRERRPDAGPGLVLPFLADYAEQVRQEEATRPFADIVERVRRGPPRWNPMRFEPIDALANSIEFFVHHEDVRPRPAGLGAAGARRRAGRCAHATAHVRRLDAHTPGRCRHRRGPERPGRVAPAARASRPSPSAGRSVSASSTCTDARTTPRSSCRAPPTPSPTCAPPASASDRSAEPRRSVRRPPARYRRALGRV